MKKIILAFFLALSTSSLYAEDSYSIGSNAEFCVYTFDDEYFLILSFKDDDENRLTDLTIVKFLLKDGSVLRLSGSNGSEKTKSKSIHWGMGITSGSSSEIHYAVLPITQDEIEKLKQGVDKAAINTIPEVYKRDSWSGKDKFGLSLYNDFKKLKKELEF